MIRRLFAAALLVLVASPAFAANPMKVTADSFVVDQGKSQATFTGSVVIAREDLTVWADKVVVEYGEGGVNDITNVLATGNVRLKTEEQEATGNRATFNPKSQVFRLSGNVTVINDMGTLHGPELVLNLAEKTSVFSSGGSGRVTGVFSSAPQ